MALKYIGTIAGYKGFKGDIHLADIVKNTPKIPKETKIEIGYSPNFTQSFKVRKWDNKKDTAVINLEGIDNESDVQKYLERGVFIDEDILNSLDEGFLSTGMISDYQVFDIDNNHLGTAIEIHEYPANDVLYIKTSEGTLPIPVIDEVVIKIDKKNKKIIVKLLDGLMDLLIRD